MKYDLLDLDTSTSRSHFVNYAAFTVSMTLNLAQRSSEVIDFCTNRKRLYDVIFLLSSNLGTILPRFRDIRAFVRQQPLFRYPSPIPLKISGCSPWSRSVMLGSAKSEHPKLTNDTIRYDTIGEFNVDWKAEYQLYLAHVARKRN